MFATFSITRLVAYYLLSALLVIIPAAIILILTDDIHSIFFGLSELQGEEMLNVLCDILLLALIVRFIKPKHRRLMFLSTIPKPKFVHLIVLTFAMLCVSIAWLDIMQLYTEADLNLVDSRELDPTISAQDSGFSFYMGLLFIAMVIVAPILEELMFRGILLDRLSLKLSPLWAIAITSLIFGLLHHDYVGNIIFGIVLCLIRLRDRTLFAPILIHMLSNLIAFLLIFSSYFFDLSQYPFTSIFVGPASHEQIAILLLLSSIVIGPYCYNEILKTPNSRFKKSRQ